MCALDGVYNLSQGVYNLEIIDMELSLCVKQQFTIYKHNLANVREKQIIMRKSTT
jgi:hypothetical protein